MSYDSFLFIVLAAILLFGLLVRRKGVFFRSMLCFPKLSYIFHVNLLRWSGLGLWFGFHFNSQLNSQLLLNFLAKCHTSTHIAKTILYNFPKSKLANNFFRIARFALQIPCLLEENFRSKTLQSLIGSWGLCYWLYCM